MSKRIAITVASSLLLFQTAGLCDQTDQLVNLDAQRNDLLKQITAQLVAGKVGPTDAQQLKAGLDNVVQIETRAQEDKNITDAEYKGIKDALDIVQSQLQADIHPAKVWMGINSRDTSLQNKINKALDTHKISKDQAVSLTQEDEAIRVRETNGSPTSEFEYTDAISIAQDLLNLEGKIDQLASTGHTE